MHRAAQRILNSISHWEVNLYFRWAFSRAAVKVTIKQRFLPGYYILYNSAAQKIYILRTSTPTPVPPPTTSTLVHYMYDYYKLQLAASYIQQLVLHCYSNCRLRVSDLCRSALVHH